MVCLDAVAPSESLDHLLASIRARLGNDPEEERAVAAEELRRLARGRLTRLVHAQAAPTVEDHPGAPPARRGEPHRDSPYVPV